MNKQKLQSMGLAQKLFGLTIVGCCCCCFFSLYLHAVQRFHYRPTVNIQSKDECYIEPWNWFRSFFFQLDLLFRFCCYILQNLSKLFGHWKIVLAYRQRKKMKKKTTKATPYLLYTYSKIEIESPFFFSVVSLSFIRSFVSSTICLCILFISVYFHQVSYIFFSSLLCDNNSSKFVNIWRYLHIMKWNKFQCEKQFSVSFWQIYTIHTYTAHTHGTHTTNE